MLDEQITAAQEFMVQIVEFLVGYGLQVVGAIIVLIVGTIVSIWCAAIFFKILQKKHVDITLAKFLASALRITIFSFALLIALGKFGITIAPFIAAFSALAFGASFAVQGPLSNYGAGISIILTRPFVVGNTITVAGVSGVVQEVKLAATVLTDEDGVKITIPNKEIVGQVIQNSHAHKIVEGVIGISYDSSPQKAIEIIRQILTQGEHISQNPKPQIGIQKFADSSIDIAYRYWVTTTRYFHVSYGTNLKIFEGFEKAEIKIPFPQRDVHLIQSNSKA